MGIEVRQRSALACVEVVERKLLGVRAEHRAPEPVGGESDRRGDEG